jgi:hypothetical protein
MSRKVQIQIEDEYKVDSIKRGDLCRNLFMAIFKSARKLF